MKNLNVYTLFLALLFTASSFAQSITLDTKPDKVVQAGEVFSVDVKAVDFDDIISLQFAVFWDPAVLQYIGVNNFNLPNVVADENFNAMYAYQGKIRFNWVDPDPNFSGFSLEDDQPIFSVQFKAIGGPATHTMVEIAGDPAHPVFPIEFVNVDGKSVNIDINPGTVTIDGVSSASETITDDFTLFQNSPNPFTATTNISFNLNQKSNTQLSIHDHAGKVVYRKIADLSAGTHTIQINRDLFASAGSYFFTLKTENATATRQLVVQ